MNGFGTLNRPDIHQGLEEYRALPGALLLDVRTPEEYRAGHIPGSRNLPLQSMVGEISAVAEAQAPLYLYCRSGARSAQAAAILRSMGYARVKDLGGILAYRGEREF